jgi:hypothetical protein
MCKGGTGNFEIYSAEERQVIVERLPPAIIPE